MKLKIAVIAAASLFAVNAHAVDLFVDWGVHDSIEETPRVHHTGPFEDGYSFSLTQLSSLFNTTVSNNVFVDGIAKRHLDGTVALFAGTEASPRDRFAFNGTTGDISFSFGALPAGLYRYLVSGDGVGTDGGSYTLTSSVTAVPEPETYALLLAGLGVIGFVARRRRLQA